MSGLRIAMWSGPRNISTAMMRSFENRGDTTVLDEPFYAHYLLKTKLNHPGRDDVLNSQSHDWNKVANMCTGDIPDGKAIWYQKHMAQHNLKGNSLDWIKKVKNCLLIRNPKDVIASYGKKFPIQNESLLGYSQQIDILERVREITGENPPILDSKDILRNPKTMLSALCENIGISFKDKMLSWPIGKRETDGIWAPYWYNRVEDSTGFISLNKKEKTIDEQFISIYDKCMVYYERLFKHRIRLK